MNNFHHYLLLLSLVVTQVHATAIEERVEIRSVQDLIGLSKQASLVKRAESIRNQNEAQVDLAYDTYLPDIKYRGAYEVDNGRLSSEVVATFIPFNRMKDTQGVRIAKASFQESKWLVRNAELQSQIQAIGLYYDFQFLLDKRKDLDRKLAYLDSLVNRARDLNKSGVNSKKQLWRLEQSLLSVVHDQKSLWAEQLQLKRRIQVEMAQNRSVVIKSHPMDLAQLDLNWLRNLEGLKTQALSNSAKLRGLDQQQEKLEGERLLAFSDHLPQLKFEARYGRFAHSGPSFFTSKGSDQRHEKFSGALILEVPLPIFDSAFSFQPIRRVMAEKEARLRIDKSEEERALIRHVELLQERIFTYLDALKTRERRLSLLDLELKDQKQSFNLGVLHAGDFVSAIDRNFIARIEIKGATAQVNADYLTLRAICGARVF